MISFLRNAAALRPGLSHKTARDIFWMLTGGDVYRMLVRERGWAPQKYQNRSWTMRQMLTHLSDFHTNLRVGASASHTSRSLTTTSPAWAGKICTLRFPV
jgi:hypothetical protein